MSLFPAGRVSAVLSHNLCHATRMSDLGLSNPNHCQAATDRKAGREASGFTQNKTLSSIQTEPSVFLCIKRADALPHRLFSYLFLSLPLQLRGYGLLRRACKLRLRRFCGPDRRYLRSIPDLFYPQQNNAFSRRGTYCS